MSYPGTYNYPSEGESLEDTADRIAASAEIKPRLTSGLERPGDHRTYSAADFLEKEPKSPAIEPATGGRSSSGPRDFQHTAAMSSTHDQIKEAHRRPAWHALGTPEVVSEQWEIVLEKIAEATAAMAAVPGIMVKAQRDRSAALADATEPTVLPSPGDARAWAERQALSAIGAAKKARDEYDRLVKENLPEHASNLAAAVPGEADAIADVLAYLRQRIQRTRDGVEAIIETAVAADPSVSRVSMPLAADLSTLDVVHAEAVALAEVAANPTQVKMTPSYRERKAIAAQQRQSVSILQGFAELARIEDHDGLTSFTHGVPREVLERARSAANFQ